MVSYATLEMKDSSVVVLILIVMDNGLLRKEADKKADKKAS